jgi:hypothetical protein
MAMARISSTRSFFPHNTAPFYAKTSAHIGIPRNPQHCTIGYASARAVDAFEHEQREVALKRRDERHEEEEEPEQARSERNDSPGNFDDLEDAFREGSDGLDE